MSTASYVHDTWKISFLLSGFTGSFLKCLFCLK